MGALGGSRLKRTRPRPGLAALACAGLLAVLAALLPDAPSAHRAPRAIRPVTGHARPNIVFVLTDDLSMDLLPYMPHVQEMQQQGLTFRKYFVSDSLCCPSRSSILTGNLPHDTGVFNNVGPHGGFHVFYRRGEQKHTFAVALRRAGYRTALMGKYLNGYMQKEGSVPGLRDTYVPPGWSEWDVAGWGYPEFDYKLNQDGAIQAHGHRPSDYLTDVLASKGVDFIDSSAAAGQPFFLELATFAPHTPYVPAPRDAADFPGLRAPRPPNFDALPQEAPRWLASRRPLTAGQMRKIDSAFRRRAQAVEAVDDMIGRIEAALTARGLADDTYLVFSSDNGLHTGEYRLMPGKLTAYDTDIHVPLVVTGPGVPAGRTSDAMAENIDLAKTFATIGGTRLAGDGHSLLPLLRGTPPGDWRQAILVEHLGPNRPGRNPDFQQPPSGNPTTYEAMRTRDFLYVEYRDGEHELYDLRQDPFELHNLASGLTVQLQALLHSQLVALEQCHGGARCWAAMHTLSVLPSVKVPGIRLPRLK